MLCVCILCVVRHVGDGFCAFLAVVPCRHPRNAVNVQHVRCRPRVRVYLCAWA